jgi:hypothetical protein
MKPGGFGPGDSRRYVIHRNERTATQKLLKMDHSCADVFGQALSRMAECVLIETGRCLTQGGDTDEDIRHPDTDGSHGRAGLRG